MSILKDKILDYIKGTPKKVILLEGNEDKAAYELLFEKRYTNWENHLLLYPAGGKSQVMAELSSSSEFIGIIDKDEWSEADLDHKRRELSNLIVIPRYCMESYLIDPQEIWEAVPAHQLKTKNYHDFRNAILENIDTWTQHAAVWHAILPLYYMLKNSGFNHVLLNDIEKIKDEDFIKKTLHEWHDILDPQNTFEKYRGLLAKLEAISVEERLRFWIHGKKFWEQHVSKKLVLFFGPKDREKYATELWKHREIPSDWESTWIEIERFQPALKLQGLK